MEGQGLFVPFVAVQRDGGPGRHLLRTDEPAPAQNTFLISLTERSAPAAVRSPAPPSPSTRPENGP
jgi:hypothetical protein